MKYICTREGWKHKLLSYTQVKECINTLYPGTILPQDINNPSLLEYFNIQKVKELFTTVVSDDVTPYCDYVAGIPFQDSTGQWCVEWKPYLNEQTLDECWGRVRIERDKLLVETDWIEQSLIISKRCKKKYEVYRQLLRDSLNVALYPHLVVFPTAPKLEYIKAYAQVDKDMSSYNPEEIESIKSYKPVDEELDNWNIFLKEWSKVNFTSNKNYVNNLILLYTNLTHETIF